MLRLNHIRDNVSVLLIRSGMSLGIVRTMPAVYAFLFWDIRLTQPLRAMIPAQGEELQ